MKLTKIETKGFKSFANKISLSFDGGVVAIVGPNGSGKSNINDAIKWVLGEQSIKSLRADNAEEVIFSGSVQVQASNEAYVSLTFDNSDGKVSFPAQEITITRKLMRGKGGNFYYINGEIARLKDIKEIAMESGISKSSLAIISQGTISDVAEATPEMRRGIFEEAAGISKYKSRKKEALKKLDSTTEALEKIRTIVRELEKQVGPLKRQADRARMYLDKKEALKDVEIALIVKDVDFFAKKLETLMVDLEGVEDTKNSLESNVGTLEDEISKKNSYKLKLENEILALSSEIEKLSSKIQGLEINESRASERRNMIIHGEMKATKAAQTNALKEELEELSKKMRKYKVWEENSEKDIFQKKDDITKSKEGISKLRFDIDQNKNAILKLKTKLSILHDYKTNKSNLFKGVKTVLENKSLFPGVVDIVANLFQVDDQNKKAIEAIIQVAQQHIVVNDSSDAIKAVEFLKQNKAGRATFIPLNVIKPKGFIQDHEMALYSLDGFVGRASELVHTKMEHQILAKFLLGNIIIAADTKKAVNIAKTFANRYMVVSQQGDIVRSGGIITGGEAARGNDLINIDSQIKTLEERLPRMANDLKELEEKYANLSNIFSENNAIISELNIEGAKVKEKRRIIEDQFNTLKITFEERTKTAFIDKEQNNEESLVSLNESRASIMTLLKAKRESVINLNNELASSTVQKTEFEKTLRHLVESSSTQLTDKAQAEFIINSSKERLSSEYEITIDHARKNYAKNIDEKSAREKVSLIKKELKEIGHVNIGAIEMYQEVNERYTKLNSSEEELFSAQQTIVSAINEMDEIIIVKLDQTVKEVDREFANVFKSMFGGGDAKLKYTDPSNLLDTGIEVVAQPPGKTIKNLKLFSGGEKALIAISLLFAIIKSRPLPVSILDEVEAALDDSNVIRFSNYLQELKKQTQFIVITHRIGTMSRVDNIIGATMQKRGVTSFFTVRLEEAKKMIDN